MSFPFLVLAQSEENNIQSITTDLNGSFSISLEENQVDAATILREFNSLVNLSEDHTFEKYFEENDNIGFTHIKYKQVYKGIPIDGGILIVHIKNNIVNSINGRIVRFDDIDLSVNISKENALEIAKLDLKVTNLTQEYPVETLIRSKNKRGETGVHLVHKVKIMSFTPMLAFDVFIDAKTGKIVSKISLSSNADVPGTTFTSYYGIQPITCNYDVTSNLYGLEEAGRNIKTYNATNWVGPGTWPPVGQTYIISTTPNFPDPNSSTNILISAAAGNAHWGMEKTYDFYQSTFGRNSYDNQGGKIETFINPPSMQPTPSNLLAGMNATAVSDGVIGGRTFTQYGLGDYNATANSFTPIDIVAHEFTHNVTAFTAELIYESEHGALNESFSDIMGYAIKHATTGVTNWTIGEDVIASATNPATGIVRSMVNPNVGNAPDTYKGLYWAPTWDLNADHGGVHTNSGVQNHWFFLLSEGGSGTNDNGDSYSVTGIGIAAAQQIAYRNLTTQLTQSSTYTDAYNGSLQAADDLYGNSSSQYSAVQDAWAAVGVGIYCNGTTNLTAASGSFDDGSNNAPYNNNSDCKWLIDVTGATSIDLSFSAFDTEAGFDEVIVYDGNTTSATVLGTFSGQTIPPTITSSGSQLLVRFTSDFAHSESGWSANYTATVPPIYGCIDPTACNYDPLANTDDGSCILPDGCTDVSACNYDPSATCDDGSCVLPDGCTDVSACNYDPSANCDDGSCILPDGCTDVSACNYDASATCDDGSCLTDYGCTDASSCNYDASATCDDGSCYNNIIASIMQDGDDLMAVTTPIGLDANWYNIQTEDSTTRIWLMEEDASSFTPTFECTYFIVVGDDNGCTDTSETYYFGATAARIGALTTSPNPTSGRVNVHFQNPRNQFVYLHLMNSNGVKLDDFITKNTELDIDISKYPSGTYYLHFNSSASQQGCNAEEVETISTKIILTK